MAGSQVVGGGPRMCGEGVHFGRHARTHPDNKLVNPPPFPPFAPPTTPTHFQLVQKLLRASSYRSCSSCTLPPDRSLWSKWLSRKSSMLCLRSKGSNLLKLKSAAVGGITCGHSEDWERGAAFPTTPPQTHCCPSTTPVQCFSSSCRTTRPESHESPVGNGGCCWWNLVERGIGDPAVTGGRRCAWAQQRHAGPLPSFHAPTS